MNGWDFGGQRVYRPTHQLFFSAPAVYLVVWKPREGSQQNLVQEWIKLVKHREPEAKILVVATHGGPGQRQPDIDRQEIWDQFGRDTVIDFFHVESKPDNLTSERYGIGDLKQAIARTASTLPEMGIKVPERWQEVRQELKQTHHPFLPLNRVLEICYENKMDREEAKLFLRISHRLGHLIHYANDPILLDIVILRPDWLATAISFVLDDKQTRDAHGLVSLKRLSELWDDPSRTQEFRYLPNLHPIFVRLMERFDLSYRITGMPVQNLEDETSLIAQLVPDIRPSLLPAWTDHPLEGDSQQVQLCRIVEANTGQSATAEGLFYQLIVRMHRYSLGRQNFADSLHWQRGLVLDDDYNGRALLEHTGNDVRITVRGAFPESFLSVLTHEVKWLVESFWAGLRCDVMVPCIEPCGLKRPGTGLFEVQKLIESKKKTRPEFPCSVCSEWQNIESLLRNAPVSQHTPIEQLVANICDDMKDAMGDMRQQLAGQTSLLTEQHAETLGRFDHLDTETQSILSQADNAFNLLMRTLVDEAKEGPRLFSLQPVDPGFFDRPKWVNEKFRLTLWCEHSHLPLPELSKQLGTPDDKSGVYDLNLPRDWFVKAAPFLKVLSTTLGLVLPVAASAVKLTLDDAAYKGIEKELEFGQKSLDSMLKGGDQIETYLDKGDSLRLDSGNAIRAEGAVLRQLQIWVKEKDPGFGGLIRVQNKRAEFLWVHPHYATEY